MQDTEHLTVRRNPCYTMPWDYVEKVLGKRRNEILDKARVSFYSRVKENYMSELAARRLNQVTNGVLQMMEIRRPVRSLSRNELDEQCRKNNHYQSILDPQKP